MNKRKLFSLLTLSLLVASQATSSVYAIETNESATTSSNLLKTTSSEPALASSEADVEASTVESTEVVPESSEKAEEKNEPTTDSSEEKADKDKKKTKGVGPQSDTDPVDIPDPTVKLMVVNTLNHLFAEGLTTGDTITKGQMEKLPVLLRGVYDFSPNQQEEGTSIGSLEGLQYAVNLTEINLVNKGTKRDDAFTSLPAGFSNLKKLQSLTFYSGLLNDIDELKNHPALEHFSATENELTSLNGLTGCKELRTLIINGSQNSSYHQNGGVQNFEGLEQSTKLQKISFEKYDEHRSDSLTEVSNPEVSYVGYGLTSLKGLNCAGSLKELSLYGHPGLHNLNGLENYDNLTDLRVSGAKNYNGRDYYYTNPGGITDIVFDPAIHTPTYNTRGLRGPNAISALTTCDSLINVMLDGQAIEDISPLGNKSKITELNINANLVKTLAPLASTNSIVTLYANNNLLTNLVGLENNSSLEHLRVQSQNAGAHQMQVNIGLSQDVLKGLLSDISQINNTSLKHLYIGDNRLDNVDSLKNASLLETLEARNNDFTNIKGDLDGCVSLKKVDFSNNYFVDFSDMGLGDAKDSLLELFALEQGITSVTYGTPSNTNAILTGLSGLEKFTVLNTLSLQTNRIEDAEMKYIPHCLVSLIIGHNELADQAFASFNPTDFTRLDSIYADYNHISNIKPLEQFPSLSKVHIYSQSIRVPNNGGKIDLKPSATPGLEVDVLKSDNGQGLTVKKSDQGWGSATVALKSGTKIIDINDANYDLDNKNISVEFNYTGISNAWGQFSYDGKVLFEVDYKIATNAELKLVPTNINGDEITEIEPGEIIYWRAKIKGTDVDRFLMKPEFIYHLQYTEHDILDPYVEPSDSLASEYVNGARVEINGVYVPTPSGIWSPQVDALHNMINKNKVADITIVTKVRDDATPENNVNLYLNVEGKNFPRIRDTKTVKVKAGAPEELNLTVPKRFDFGKRNEASKLEKTYGLDTKAHSNDEQTGGFKIRVTDSMRNANRVDWEVVGKLSDLTASNGAALKNASVSPKLSLKDIALFEITGVGGTETATAITHGAAGKPTWNQNIDLTAGGPSVTLSEADKADGEGVWDYQIPFDKVKLEVPSNVNNQAGYTFNGKITWTLDDTL